MKLLFHYPLALNRALDYRNGQKWLCRSWCRSAKSIHFLVAGFRDRRSLGSFGSFWPNTGLDCKTVHTFAFSSTREQSNKGLSGSLEAENGERDWGETVKIWVFASNYGKPNLIWLFCSLIPTRNTASLALIGIFRQNFQEWIIQTSKFAR